MQAANIHETETRLSVLVEAATNGDEVVIRKAGKPVLPLAPAWTKPAKRNLGLSKTKISMAPDWDAPEVNDESRRRFEAGRSPACIAATRE